MAYLAVRYIAVLLAGILLGGCGRGQEYRISLARTHKVGDIYTVVASGKITSASTMSTGATSGPARNETSGTTALDITVEVLGIDKDGHATKCTCKVGKCIMNDKPLFEPGTVITVESRDGKIVYFVDGTRVDRVTEMVIAMALLWDSGSPADRNGLIGAAFGTDQPQRAGGTWPVNSEKLAATSSGAPGGPKKEDITGSVKFVGTKHVEGGEALQIEADFTAVSKGPVGNETTFCPAGTMTTHLEILWPTDVTRQSTSISTREERHTHSILKSFQGTAAMETQDDRVVTMQRTISAVQKR